MDKRQHPRHPARFTLKLQHPSFGEKLVKTRDISDGGVFLIVDPSEAPPLGQVVKGQVQGLMADAPILEMEVVRVENEGIGLKYVLSDDQ